MSNVDTVKVDQYLFGRGLRLEDYFIERTPVSEVVGYINSDGKEFDLIIDDPALFKAAKTRLLELGVRVVKLG